jgi:hypothetical protein
MPQTRMLFPYAHTSQIALRPSDPYDPTDEDRIFNWTPIDTESDEEVSTYDLSHEQRSWEQIRFKVEASLPEEELNQLLPTGFHIDADVRMYVGLECASTRLREAVELVRTASEWSGDILIRRKHVRGTVRLTPFLVRATDIPSLPSDASAQVATEHAMRIGEGRSLALVVDPPDRKLQRFVNTVWEHFESSANPLRRDNKSLVFDLELDGEEPLLILNSAYTGMRAALHSRKRSGGAAVMRHAVNGTIAVTVWTQLYLAAIGSIDYSEESGELTMPATAWKRRVLQGLIDQAPSNLPKDERLKSMVQLRDEHLELLVPMLALTAQKAVRLGKLIKDAERAAESIASGEESVNDTLQS